MKILYVSQYFPPEMGAPAARVSELAQLWTGAGHQVTVLTGFPNHPTGVVAEEYRGKLRRLVIREKFRGVDVVRTWLLPLPNRKSYERILNYSSFFVSSAIAGLFVERPDVVIGTSPQLLTALSACWLAKMMRVPFVFEVRDLWPESLASVEVAGRESALYGALVKVAAFLYRQADRIVVVSPAFEDVLTEHWRVPREKISVVPNGVNESQFSPAAANAGLRGRLGVEERFVVTYIGTMGVAHGLETLVEAAERVARSNEKIEFLLVGEGADKARIEALVASRGIRNVRFFGQQRREIIAEYICASDACVVLLRKTELFKTVIPSKMLEFMACGRPLILAVDGEARKIMEEAGCGIFIEPEDSGALAEAIVKLAEDECLRADLGMNGRRFVVENYARTKTAETYIGILNELLSGALLDGDNGDGGSRLQSRLEGASS